jgi:hypothetical protein
VLIGALFDLINDNAMAFEVPASLSGRYNPSNCRLACSASYSASQAPVARYNWFWLPALSVALLSSA